MRRLVVNMLALAVVLTGVSIGLGQQTDSPSKRKVIRVEEEDFYSPKAKAAPTKSKLEEMLAEALKNNPDIRVAVAKMAKADAELNRTRLQVTQKVVELYYAIDSQKKIIALQEQKLAAVEQSHRSAQIGLAALLDARQAVTLAKAKLSELEAQMPALLGKVEGLSKNTDSLDLMRITIGSDAGLEKGRLEVLRPHAQRAVGPLADKIRKALETPVTVNYKDLKFSEILKDLEKKAPGLSFHIRDLPTGGQFSADEAKVKLHFDTPLPIAAILQAIEDDTGAHFIVRDYGILVTTGKLPPGALTVQDFTRQKPAETRKDYGPNMPVLMGTQWEPPENAQGTVQHVDARGSLTIAFESEVGLLIGHTFDLYRPTDKSAIHLGTIRITSLKGKEAVAHSNGRLLEAPKVGDKVGRPREKK